MLLRKLPKISSESSFADLYLGGVGIRKGQKWSNLAMFRGPDPTAGGFAGGVLVGLENRGFGVPFRVPWRPFGTPDGHVGSRSWARGGRSRSALHEKMHVLVCTLLESFRPLHAGASHIL